ncbi:16137_t:CDS:2 [Funneliformis mosseae]|uniref:16137_t:CDS:1 n=1 Tax=Funneliformis mosseae TaxID=27381 RepID=A0A9N8UWF0_FUNMO|nr:16137_t:CDS:2 [Funneliformis mosseae]
MFTNVFGITGGGFMSNNRKDENEINFIFHVHMPENIDTLVNPL